MEDVTDAVFRRICRDRGADLCVTEFVNVEGLLRGCRDAAHKIALTKDDFPTAIQIYGADAARLAEAAIVAEEAEPVFLDINCGCWVPKIARRGAGAGWLRDPDAMVRMAASIVRSVSLPVTVKTRIGYGPESEMPIIDLARRLEDVGVRALTIHCRTANMGHSGKADWQWAARARAVVSMPVIVNGDICSGPDAAAALDQTGCHAVMIGRAAIDHPWILGDARVCLDGGAEPAPPTAKQRIELCRQHLIEQCAERGEIRGVRSLRRYYPGYLRGLHGAANLRRELNATDTQEGVLELLSTFEAQLAARTELAA